MEWNVKGLKHYLFPNSNIIQKLEPAIYLLDYDHKIKQLYLDRERDSFNFDYKIYNLDKKFIDRVAKTYQKTTNNLGILLHGIKGTGKSVTAKMICNILKLPVILVTNKYADATLFFNNIHQDVIIFIDEYEKIYEKGGVAGSNDLLSLMDGVLGNSGRKVFLLTSNLNRVNDNMMQRPSRILYNKAYGNLDLESIIEVVDDILEHKNRRDRVIDFISQLELITIDIIKSVVTEVNIHDEDPAEFESFFNVLKIQQKHNVYKIDVTGEETIYRLNEYYMPVKGYTVNSVGTYFYTQNNVFSEGKIIKVNGSFDIIVDPNEKVGDEWDDDSDDNNTSREKKDNIRFLIKTTETRHERFISYYKK